MKTTGITLLIIGIALTIFTSIKYFTKERVADLGIVEISTNQPHAISWSPILGILVMVVGGLFLLQAVRQRK